MGVKKAENLQGLNAPYGARCFLTEKFAGFIHRVTGLNAPYGARCFLTLTVEDRVSRTVAKS